MTERSVVLAEEREVEVVDHIGIVKTKSVGGYADDFDKPAEELKSLSGTDAVFKRKVTNDIKKFQKNMEIEKFQRGTDGTSTKQINEKTFYSGYDTYDVIQPPYNLDYLCKLYELSAPHYAAVNAKVSNIVGLGYKLVENNSTKRNLEKIEGNAERLKTVRRNLAAERDSVTDELEAMNEEDTLTETLIKVWRDYEVTGNGYLEVGRKKDGTIGFIGHIPSQTMRIRRLRDGFVQIAGFEVQFFAHFGAGLDENGNPQTVNNPLGGGKPNEVIHISKYSPTSGYYGIPDIVAAKQAVAGNEFVARYNLDYFENKAVPRYAIILKGAKLGVQAEAQLLSFFETGLKGQNHRSVYIPLPGDTPDNKVELKFEAIESGVQEASFTGYSRQNLAEILMAHRVPITKVSVADGASLAVAKDADKTFKEQVCQPEQSVFEKKLNRIVKELTNKLELSLNEMTLTDENTQSQIDERRRKTGVETANEQRIKRGDPAIEGGDELFDMNAALKLGQETNQINRQQLKQQADAANKAHELAITQAKNPAPVATPTAPSPVTNRTRDANRSANATDSAGQARNPKGDGRTTP